MRPLARKRGLVVRRLGDETVVYDTETHEAHCLNRTAAVVFRHADGQRSVAELAALLGGAGTAEVERLVDMALEQLATAHLLEGPASPPPETGVARRDLMRRIGLGAAILLPMVSTILVPSPSEAANTCAVGAGACNGLPDFTPCTCTVPPCTGSCISNICVDGATTC